MSPSGIDRFPPTDSDQNPTVQIKSLLRSISELRSKTSINKVERAQSFSEGIHDSTMSNGETNLRRSKTEVSNVPLLDDDLHKEVEKLHRNLSYINDALEKLRRLEASVTTLINTLVQRSKDGILGHFLQAPEGPGLNASNLEARKIQGQLSMLSEIVMKLKLHIPSNSHEIESSTTDANKYEQVVDQITANYLPDLATDGKFLVNPVYKDFRSSYEHLDTQKKLCFLCFAVFPEGAVIKKRFLHYWWVGEEFVDPDSKDTSGDILNKFVEMGFIHPVIKKRRAVTKSKSYKMLPLTRSMVVILAREAEFFDFDSKGYPSADFSKSLRCCLMRSEEGSLLKTIEKDCKLKMENLHTLLNVNEPFLDLEVEWFKNMKNVNVLSLGRWKGPNKDHIKNHIEVTNTEFLRGFKHMKHLKFFSLQGISRITELPDSIGELYSLQILDLRACHNLESLPDEIRSLKELRNLDVSGCYLLEYMPKGLGSLLKLELLMGFVVSDVKHGSSCTLKDLVKLQNLRKFGVSTSRESFPTVDELTTLQKLNSLKKLTIAWGGKRFSANPNTSGTGAESLAKDGKSISTGEELTTLQKFKKLKKFAIPCGGKSLSATSSGEGAESSGVTLELQKLDLICYPLMTQPTWLTPAALPNLRTLYIRGGNLYYLGRVQGEDKEWQVETLHLMFLNELTIEWRQLRKSFPKLVCLQKIDCPKLTLFPCDEDGVWLEEKFFQSHQESLKSLI